MFSDRGMKNDMATLSIRCSGCRWIGLLKEYQVTQIDFNIFF